MSISVCSVNCQGLQNYKKRKDVFDYLRKKPFDIYFLQETHIPVAEQNYVRALWGYETWISGMRTDSSGVAILFKNSFEFKVHNVIRDAEGHFLLMDVTLCDRNLILVNIYAPSHGDIPEFFDKIEELLLQNNYENSEIILGGDWNVFLDPDFDCCGYRQSNYKEHMRERLIAFMDKWHLTDIWRDHNPGKMRYTWRRPNPLQQSRIDFLLITDSLQINRIHSSIEASYKSDHSPVCLNIHFQNRPHPRPFWKFNNSLLKDPKYIQEVKKVILDVKQQYASDQNETINIDDIPNSDLLLTVDDHLFLEMLLMEIRGKTISYASHKKKEKEKQEKDLVKNINIIESNLSEANKNDYEELKEELRILRENKLEGMIVRSRAKWQAEGERPSRYFLHLENRHCTNKAITSIKKENGQTITEQKEMLQEVKSFYQRLYASREDELCRSVNLDDLVGNDVPKLNKSESDKLEGKITEAEALSVLKLMKTNKSPGSDGFSVEFFKMFWEDLASFVVRSANYSLEKGEMSISQRQGIIVCIPKEGKSKDELKNWRPISLLNVVYKIISSCIANRLKSVLPKLIHTDQKGFMSGRFIGETIRLIYDILHYTEEKNVPGILVSVDFEKAFDSVAHSFIEKCLVFFNFGTSIRKWIATFYKSCVSCVEVNGQFTTWFEVNRGVRQGDPISPYLFLLCAEILGILIRNNEDIKGIVVKDKECKISQFADDTEFTLDGSEKSFTTTFQVLDAFAKISGLKINYDKTLAVWIGSEKYSDKRFMPHYRIVWDPGIFRLLGIKFTVELNKMPKINFEGKLHEIRRLLTAWGKRNLTPYGKICIMKSLVASRITHLFLALPDPPKEFLKEVNTMFFRFLWNGKTDRIKRTVVMKDYRNGGLKMIDIYSTCKSLKITWIRRLIQTDSSWVELVKQMYPDIKNLQDFGSVFVERIRNGCKNEFWFDVLTHWQEFQDKVQLVSFQDLLAESIHFNSKFLIGKQPIKLFSWVNQGILKVRDIVTDSGNFLRFPEFEQKFGSNISHFLQYQGVIESIEQYRKHNLVERETKKATQLDLSWRVVTKYKKGTAGIKEVLCGHKSREVTKVQKWERDLNYEIDWNDTFSQVYKTTADPKLRWFQLKVLYRLLPTEKFLFNCKIKSSPLCKRCKEEEEDIVHLLWNCTESVRFWNDFTLWIKNGVPGRSDFWMDPEYVILGTARDTVSDSDKVLDLLIMLGKYYLYTCKIKDTLPSLIAYKRIVRFRYLVEKGQNVYKCSTVDFYRDWLLYRGLLEI